MNVKSIMSTEVMTIRPNDLLTTAAQVMLWSGGRHLPVVDGGELVGVLSEGDLFRARGETSASRRTLVREAMTKPVKTTTMNESIAIAARRMAVDKIGCLPVIGRGKLVGIVTTTDVLRALEDEVFAKRRTALDDELGVEVINLRALRDRARLKAHLGGMDLRDAWNGLHADIGQAERLVATAANNAAAFVRKVRQRAEKLLVEARKKSTAKDTTKRAKPRAKTAKAAARHELQ